MSGGVEAPPASRTLAPLGRRAATVLSNAAVGPYRLIAALDAEGPAEPQPGQFYMLATAARWGGGADERPYLPRAFSFARARRQRGQGLVLEFLLEAVGPGTARLGEVEPGEELVIVGPLGRGFSAPAGGAVLVGGGIGIAPILAWHDVLGAGTAPVLLGFRSAAHAEAAALFSPTAEVVTDDGSVGRRAFVTDPLRRVLDRRAEAAGPGADGRGAGPTVYACGPPPMLEAVRVLCAERAVEAELALESGMACGFGACFGCVVPTRSGYVRLCLDGPVLPAGELETALVPGAGH